MSTALIFPGQGSQYIGMGKELYDTFLEAREVFEEVDDVLNQHLSRLIFSGDLAELTQTQNAQPAIMATSIASLRVLEKQAGKKVNEICQYVCGHSLGEYSAHAAAGSFSLSETAKLLKIRGTAMNEASAKLSSGMVALIGSTTQQAEALTLRASDYGVCEIANDNGAGQVVISGEIEAVDWAIKAAQEFGIRRAIKLNVSGAFHSRLMENAAIVMKEALLNNHISRPNVYLVANFNVQIVAEKAEIIESLVAQITGRVRWRETMEYLAMQGVDRFIEVGPGMVLSGLAKRINENAYSTSICTPNDIETLLKL